MSRAIKRIAALGIGELLALGLLLSLTLLRAPLAGAQPVMGLGGAPGGQTTQPVYHPGYHPGVTLPARAAPCATPSPAAGAIAQPDPANWSQFGFDAAGTRCNPYENRLSPSTVPNLHLAWSLTTIPFGVTPAIVNGIIYIPSSYPDNTLYAIKAATGAMLWSAPIPTEVETSPTAPAVANGTVYLGVNNSVYTFNATNGTPGWSFTTGNLLQTPPAVSGNYVFVASQDSTLYALDATTGKLLWKATISGPYVGSSPVAVSDRAIFVAAGSELAAYDLSTGKTNWAISFPVSGSSPVYANGLLYIGGFDFNVYAINAATGAVVWVRPTANVVNGTVAVDATTAYIGSADGKVYAYNAQTGHLNWSFGNPNDVIFSSAAVADGVVYITSACRISCGTDSGYHVYAYTASTGVLLWKYAPGYAVYASPVVVDGTLYVSTYIGLDAFTA